MSHGPEKRSKKRLGAKPPANFLNHTLFALRKRPKKAPFSTDIGHLEKIKESRQNVQEMRALDDNITERQAQDLH